MFFFYGHSSEGFITFFTGSADFHPNVDITALYSYTKVFDYYAMLLCYISI